MIELFKSRLTFKAISEIFKMLIKKRTMAITNKMMKGKNKRPQMDELKKELWQQT